MVDTSADGIRRDARAVMKGQVERLSGLDVGTDGSSLSELVEALSGVGEMCREDGTAGEANRTAFGEVSETSIASQSSFCFTCWEPRLATEKNKREGDVMKRLRRACSSIDYLTGP